MWKYMLLLYRRWRTDPSLVKENYGTEVFSIIAGTVGAIFGGPKAALLSFSLTNAAFHILEKKPEDLGQEYNIFLINYILSESERTQCAMEIAALPENLREKYREAVFVGDVNTIKASGRLAESTKDTIKLKKYVDTVLLFSYFRYIYSNYLHRYSQPPREKKKDLNELGVKMYQALNDADVEIIASLKSCWDMYRDSVWTEKQKTAEYQMPFKTQYGDAGAVFKSAAMWDENTWQSLYQDMRDLVFFSDTGLKKMTSAEKKEYATSLEPLQSLTETEWHQLQYFSLPMPGVILSGKTIQKNPKFLRISVFWKVAWDENTKKIGVWGMLMENIVSMTREIAISHYNEVIK